MRLSATNVGLTAYTKHDAGEYTPEPFEVMSESQMGRYLSRPWD